MPKTLQEAATTLGVEQKTLRKWMRDTGIAPAQDDVDLRRRLLSDEQIDVLRNRYRRSAQTQDELASLVRSLQQQVAALTKAVTSLQAKM